MNRRRSWRWGGGGRPQTQGWVWRLSWPVATRVATGDLGAIGETLAGVRRAAQAPPPRLDQVEPARADRDEDLLDTRMGSEPVTDGATRVAGEIVRDEIQIAYGVVLINLLKQLEIADGIACGRGLGTDLPIADAQRSVDPGLVVPAAVDEWDFDAVAIP
jgi:hypothetical protein